MKKLLTKAVLCSDWAKVAVGVSIISIGLLLPGCATMNGVGDLVSGIGQDISGASVAIKNEIGN